jgi:hypothetical protein
VRTKRVFSLRATRAPGASDTLVAGLQIVTKRDVSDARRRDLDPGQAKLVGEALGTVSRTLQTVVEHARLDLRGDAVRMGRTGAAAALYERRHAARLEGAAHFVDGVAVKTHDAAGLGHVAEVVGELQRRALAFDTLTQSSPSGFSLGN